jgi:hypothetical protein
LDIPKFNIGDSISMKGEVLRRSACGQSKPFIYFPPERSKIKMNSDPFAPTLLLKGPYEKISLCEEIIISINQIFNDGRRGLVDLNFSLISMDPL